jgi:hypothetical protein
MTPDYEYIENAVDRTEAAIIEEATAIARLRFEIALIIEALEKLDLCKNQGLKQTTAGAAAVKRYREIVQQLKASDAANNSSWTAQNSLRQNF